MTFQLKAGQHVVGYTDEIPPGTRKIVNVEGREIGIFNIRGTFRAFLNRCPHMSGPLCHGEVLSLVESSGPGDMRMDDERQFLTCPLHGWEFDVETGQSYFDPKKMRAKVFAVETVPDTRDAASTEVPSAKGDDDPSQTKRIPGKYAAEMFDIAVESGAVILTVGRSRRRN